MSDITLQLDSRHKISASVIGAKRRQGMGETPGLHHNIIPTAGCITTSKEKETFYKTTGKNVNQFSISLASSDYNEE